MHSRPSKTFKGLSKAFGGGSGGGDGSGGDPSKAVKGLSTSMNRDIPWASLASHIALVSLSSLP